MSKFKRIKGKGRVSEGDTQSEMKERLEAENRKLRNQLHLQEHNEEVSELREIIFNIEVIEENIVELKGRLNELERRRFQSDSPSVTTESEGPEYRR